MPLQVGTLEEMIDDNHAIVSTVGDHYVPILSFVDKDRAGNSSSGKFYDVNYRLSDMSL